MELLKQRIIEQGIVKSDQLLKVDAFLNHQIDPFLVQAMGKELAARFKNDRVTKVLTIESSGISIAYATALELGVPLVFARRKRTLATDSDIYIERVPSFTKGIVTDILVSKQFLSRSDHILLIDDIIANGDAVRGLIRIIEQSGASLAGLGIAIEKSFQAGARTIRDLGVRLESLVRIESLKDGRIEFA